MRNALNVAAAFAAGALAMYFFDTRMGARRRARVRDKVVAASHDAADFLENKGKRAADRVKGVVATGRLDRHASSQPRSDTQLCERVRSRLGHLIGQPKAVEVEVEGGLVRLKGHVLAREIDRLLADVSGMAGVHRVHNALSTHEHAREITDLMGRHPLPQEQQAAPQTQH